MYKICQKKANFRQTKLCWESAPLNDEGYHEIEWGHVTCGYAVCSDCMDEWVLKYGCKKHKLKICEYCIMCPNCGNDMEEGIDNIVHYMDPIANVNKVF